VNTAITSRIIWPVPNPIRTVLKSTDSDCLRFSLNRYGRRCRPAEVFEKAQQAAGKVTTTGRRIASINKIAGAFLDFDS
jgi:hypothetical protein